AAILRIGLEQPFHCVEAVYQALGVIEAVDTNDEPPVRETLAQPRRLASARRTRCPGSDEPRINADRKARGADAGPVRVHCPIVAGPAAGFPLDIIPEGLQVAFRLKADEIISKQRAHQRLVHRQRREHLGRREGDMQEEPDWVVDTQPTQCRAERYHVIVVNPQNVVGLESRGETFGEHLVDPTVGRPSLSTVLCEVHTIVEYRPEHAIGEFEIITLVVGAFQIDEHAGEPSLAVDARRARRLVRDLAAPTEPDHLALIEGCQHRGREATFVALERRADTVRRDDQPPHSGLPRLEQLKRRPNSLELALDILTLNGVKLRHHNFANLARRRRDRTTRDFGVSWPERRNGSKKGSGTEAVSSLFGSLTTIARRRRS